MSADEFWKDDPQLFVSYRTSFVNKKKRSLEELDYKCWLQGLYIHDGNGRLFSSLKQFIGNMFSKSKNNKEIGTYPTKPYSEQEKDKVIKDKEIQRNKRYESFEENLSYIGSMKQRYLENLKKQKS